jgi:AbrB family looped-hinge helix DNA binding protein
MYGYRAQVKEGGRIVIPAKAREKLHFDVGEELLLRIEGEELHILSLRVAIKKAQALAQKYNPSHKSLTAALFKMRKKEND